MPDLRLTLLVGSYAQKYVLGPGSGIERVYAFSTYLPKYFPLPHPSWRAGIWAQKHPWFDEEVVPALRTAIRRVLAGAARSEHLRNSAVSLTRCPSDGGHTSNLHDRARKSAV